VVWKIPILKYKINKIWKQSGFLFIGIINIYFNILSKDEAHQLLFFPIRFELNNVNKNNDQKEHQTNY
jgi:hypothetical protein